MAEQNRKTPEQKVLRFEAQKVVDTFLDYVFAESDERDIANESRHILGTYSEHGSLPQGSGFSGFCNLGAKVDRMRWREVTGIMLVAKDIMARIEDDDLINAICVDRMFRGKTRAIATDPLNGKTVEFTYQTADCAKKLDASEDVYRKRVSRGYLRLEEVIQPKTKAA